MRNQILLSVLPLAIIALAASAQEKPPQPPAAKPKPKATATPKATPKPSASGAKATAAPEPGGKGENGPRKARAATPKGKELTRAEVDAYLARPNEIFILDVRKEEEIAKIGSLPGYVNIPLDQLEKRINEVPKDRTILPLSNHAVRAWKAQAILEKHGYKVPGGIGVQNYEAAGGTLVFPPVKTLSMNWGKKGFAADQRAYWAYQPVKRPAVPTVKATARVQNPIDNFVLTRLEARGLSLSPEADRRTLLRRVTLDVTGLPPTPQEVDAFLADTSPDAYEKVVDDLLGRKTFGEHWARKWLDVARYGDTDGYIQDQRRPNSWRYRDWVIHAINDDKPYDRFVKEQVAGDELWPDNIPANVATGFLRGYQDEFNARNIGLRRQEILNDITDTTTAAFLGQTVSCARCHDHKFDAIRQEDYFRFQAFFANAIPRDDRPVIEGAELAKWKARRAEWEAATREIRAEIETLVAPHRELAFQQRLPGFVPDDRIAITTPAQKRTPLQKWIYARYEWRATGFERAAIARLVGRDIGDTAIMDNGSEEERKKLQRDRARYRELTEELRKYDPLDPGPLPVASVMTEETPVAPPTHLLYGGTYGNTGYEVKPGFLAVVNPADPKIGPTARRNTTGRRSALAHWIADPANPLTARVAVNRLWAGHFGRGIVATPSDFGVMGERPTHPELLDWLASELVRQGWSQKRIHRLILLSATYRQSSNPSPLALERDGRNALFSRFDRRRLSAEEVRDSVLAVSGLLQTDTIGGPAVQPPLPEGFQQGGGRARNVISTDPREYNRRSVYIAVKRNQPDPTLEVFDAPPSFDPCPRRAVSTTALQALTLFNSDQAVGWAQALAAQAVWDAYGDEGKQVTWLYRRLFGRAPSDGELLLAVNFLARQREVIQVRVTAGEAIALPTPVAPPDKATGAALVDLSLALINSNEFLYIL